MTTKKSEHVLTQDALSSSADQLIGEFKSLMADAEALIKATEDHPSETINAIRIKALETMTGAKESLSNLEGTLTEKAKVVAEGADDFVHRNPWEAVGVAAGLGLLIGLFIRRR
ncbi:hypothetical protein A8O14_05660 [Polynucleobacter wuianus]|uniref:DUF883 domain-containing protein n=1 Tax=Polynucleobacter wuianus TaxID=1743168 RepID=A0A191UFC9_9BURK|nr:MULTISPECIES: DUF883 family protein [Polynucleobacter]ANI99610.1 hypothetical protein A8O14_05660 [Polynucleobacter wuianus]MBU3551749.1 DUF883 domain-containing protein [Polynucleobacter sp. MWH-Post4-6-1]MBU3610718.1 DUF883 domain-containing protein [Polynucleobacter wuianus]